MDRGNQFYIEHEKNECEKIIAYIKLIHGVPSVGTAFISLSLLPGFQRPLPGV
jgi:hypothetical protein